MMGGLAAALARVAGTAATSSAAAATQAVAPAIVFSVSPDGQAAACTAGDPCSLGGHDVECAGM
jgi:hypothetical protein